MSPVPGLLLTYYGDDLTGSTDVMEALSLRGIPTVLFVSPPSAAQLARHAPPGTQAIGLAGTSRSETTEWMEANLPGALGWLAGLGAPICHYKVCSTFDSSPTVGSIGRALDIGRRVFGGGVVPIVVGAPQLRRYTVFGQLFAAYGGETWRIDRHPVMSRHPVTPMDEADLRRHLGRQTQARIGHVDQIGLTGAGADRLVDAACAAADALLLDVCDEASQRAAGRQMLRLAAAGSRFVVGSSGVEYALAAARAENAPGQAAPHFPPLGPAGRIAVVSGSVSPTTERQIRHAATEGFRVLALDPLSLLDDEAAALARAAGQAAAALRDGHSVIIHTALGPGSDLGARLAGRDGARHAIGRGLGRLLARLVRDEALTRAVIAGGDTSSHALREMGVVALTTALPLAQTPGSPLCTAHGGQGAFDGLQIALKGGQIGRDDYFLRIREGSA